MPRMYTVEFDGVSISGPEDLIAIYASATYAVRVQAIQLAASGQTTVSNVSIVLKHLAATVTHGSGGTAPTPVRANPGDSAASFTARANDTTKATSAGTTVVMADMFNPINGYFWQAPIPSEAPEALISEALVLSLNTTPSVTLTANGTIWVEEL